MVNDIKFRLGKYIPVTVEEETKIIKKIKLFLHMEDNYEIAYQLCNINALKRKDLSKDKRSSSIFYKIVIETSRPGILIGKKGHLINSLKKFLELELNSNLDIKIVESKIITTY